VEKSGEKFGAKPLKVWVMRELQAAKRRAAKKKRANSHLEDAEQKAFVQWARTRVDLVWHTPNARKYSRGSWHYWKSMGVEAGIPDILIMHFRHCQLAPSPGPRRIALEFKAPGRKPTKAQRRIHDIFAASGWSVVTVYSAEEAKRVVTTLIPRIKP
jgi:hypothetical protein